MMSLPSITNGPPALREAFPPYQNFAQSCNTIWPTDTLDWTNPELLSLTMSGGLFQRSAGRAESSVGWLVAREGTCWELMLGWSVVQPPVCSTPADQPRCHYEAANPAAW